MILHLLHDCPGVRHRTPLELREVPLESRHLRLEGTRCDGTPIKVYANRNGSTLVVYTEHADTPGDSARYQRIMLDETTGTEWVSHDHGPWEPLATPPDIDAPTLFDLEPASAK